MLDDLKTSEDKPPRKPLFPVVKGLLAFDTPYCGLSRLMFAYGAFAQYKTISSAYGLLTSLSAAALPSRIMSGSLASKVSSRSRRIVRASSTPAWRAWQLVALRTGTAGAIAAAGAAAYMHREQIARGWNAFTYNNVKETVSGVSLANIEQGLAYISKENISLGWAWMSSHLQFVGALTRGEEMRIRIERLSAMKGMGFANLYGSLGENSAWTGGRFVAERTFVAVPGVKSKANRFFVKEVNTAVKDEIQSHVSMFVPRKNTGFEEMLEHATGLIVAWHGTHHGLLEDQYDPGLESRASMKVKEAKVPAITRYTYSQQTGLKEISQRPTGLWSLGQYAPSMPSMPAMPAIPSSIPSLWQKKSAAPATEPAEEKPAYTRYYWNASTGILSDDDENVIMTGSKEALVNVEKASENPTQSPETDVIKTALPRQDAQEEDELDSPEDVPGVTEDMQLDED